MRIRCVVADMVVIAVCLFSTTAFGQLAVDNTTGEATPFGLKRGMTLAQLGAKPEQIAPGMYRLKSVPRPHPSFESYLAQVGATTGLCFIKGVGRDTTTSVYGTELKAEYEKIRDQVSGTYGRYQEIDMLRAGSIWDEPRDWMMGLVKKERMLGATWGSEAANLRPGLARLFVGVSGSSSQAGYVVIEYYFDNEPQCQKEIDNAAASVF